MLAVFALAVHGYTLLSPPSGSTAFRSPIPPCDADRCYYGAVDADGNVVEAEATPFEGPAPKPSPLMTPSEMVDAQFSMLKAGAVEAAFAFVSPTIKSQYDMDVAKFRKILESPAFDGLIGCSEWKVLTESRPSDDVCAVSVRVLPKPIPGCVRVSGVAGQEGITWPSNYKWMLSRNPTEAMEFPGCWMLDNMMPYAAPIDVGAKDGTQKIPERSTSKGEWR